MMEEMVVLAAVTVLGILEQGKKRACWEIWEEPDWGGEITWKITKVWLDPHCKVYIDDDRMIVRADEFIFTCFKCIWMFLLIDLYI